MGKANNPAEWFGEADFEFGGEDYRITFDNMAILEAEGVLGVSMLEWLPRLYETVKAGGNPMIRDLAALVYGGLKQNHPNITQREVVSMAMSKDEGLREAIKQALAAIEIPEDAVAELGNGPAPKQNRKARRAKKAKT